MKVCVRLTPCVLLALATGWSSAQSLNTARADARLGKVDAALAELNASSSPDAGADALRCKLYASVERFDDAVHACEAAAALAPRSSNDALALARAYGDKAEHAGSLTGMRLVGKIRSTFERAVQLDTTNVEALSDLGEFYVEAPSLVGGGVDKAQALVARLQPLSAARAHRLAAMVAQKRGDATRALQELHAELAAEETPEAYVDVARYYRKQKQWDAAAHNAKLALERDSRHGPDTLDAAHLLLEMKRDIPAAQDALRSYLNSPQTNVASYARAHVMLGQSLQQSDRAQARAQFEAALALAHDYPTAQQGLNQ